MRRFPWYPLLMLLMFPCPSRALQLHWSSGGMNLTFAAATRCTLLVQAEPGEARLPTEWRLLWAADSAAVGFVVVDSATACLLDEAQVSRITGPATAADSAANQITVHFCSATSSPASIAAYILDLPAGARGKLKVVAVDPADQDSSRITQSNEATFNGGVPDPYPPAILRTTTVHRSTAFRLNAVGTGLADVREATLAAPDRSWELPLRIATEGDTAIILTASLAASVPGCVVQAVGGNGAIGAGSVPADPPTQLPEPFCPSEGDESKMREVWPDHDPYLIQPKDFAFVPGGWTAAGNWTYHLFYIRHNQYLLDENTEKNIGHAVSDVLSGWTVIDTAAVRTRGARWDSLHVWAPSIVLKGLTYNLFYVGVDKDGNQRIGLATSTDLVNWAQGDSVLEVTPAHQQQIPWADPSPGFPYAGRTQLRDPFVMEDPDNLGYWLMYFVTVPTKYSPEMVVGVARSNGDFNSWGQSFPLWKTHQSWPVPEKLGGGSYVVESPHAFLRNGKWYLFSTVNYDSVWAESNDHSPSDTLLVGARWSPPEKLCTLVPPLQTPNLYFWHATEYLQINEANDIEYLAAWNDANVCISITQMLPSPPYLFKMCVPSALDVERPPPVASVPRLLLTDLRQARSRVGLRIDLPSRMRIHLAVYDVMGRRIRTLADNELPAGETGLSWDGRDQGGSLVGSGLYFASLTAAGSRQTVRVPLIR